MTNPFNKTPNTQTSAPAQTMGAPGGYNPFEGSNNEEDFLKVLPADVTAKVKVLSYRIKPKAPNSPTAVFVDLELLEVLEGASTFVAAGKQLSHKVSGFESSGAAAARRGLKSLNRAIFPELLDDGSVNWDTLPFQIQDAGNAAGRVLYIRTYGKSTKTIDQKTGKPFVITLGEYMPVEGASAPEAG